MAAGPTPNGKEQYQFGPFRVDPRKEVLLREGEPVSLTPKSFQILLVLVRHHKEVVSKDDLMKAVWPDTFVEEANLSRNIFMLRKALGDNAQDRYIVTVPGRGYRLAEDVQLVPQQELSVVAASHQRVQVEVKETKAWVWAVVAAVILVGGVAAGWRFTHRRPTLTEKDSVLIADFANSTGDPVFDGALRQGLAVQLEQSPYINLVPEGRVHNTLRMMGKDVETRITGATAREVCERTGATAVLEGSIAGLGTQYVLGVRANNCRSGAVIDEQQVQVTRKEDVLKALTEVASRFRSKIGESLSSVQQHNTPLEEATTPSLEALKAYDTAVDIGLRNGFGAGIPFLKHAIELDPNFALAYAHLGLWYNGVGEVSLARECNAKAYELRNRVSERERLFITSVYERDVIGNLERSLQTLNAWAQIYPRDFIAHGFLSGFTLQGLGKYQESIDESKKAQQIDPDRGPPYVNEAFSFLYLGKLDEADATASGALNKGFQMPELYLARYHVAALRNDEAGMHRAAAVPAGVPAQDWMIHSEALVAARGGELEVARRTTARAVNMALAENQKETAATYEAAEAAYETFYGDMRSAKRSANAALNISKGRDVEYAAAFAMARAGEYSRAEELAGDLSKQFPEDTSVQFSYLPTLRGLFALHRNDPAKAIEELEPAVQQEYAQTGLSFFAFFGNMYPTYVRGEAYAAQKNYKGAVAEFQKVVDHPGLVLSDPMGVVARVEMARAYAALGDKARASEMYKQVTEIWKEADENPIVARVRSEAVRVQ